MNADLELAGYLRDANSGVDDDWTRHDDNANAAALFDIQAVLRGTAPADDKLARIGNIINTVQLSAAITHVRALEVPQ